MLPSTGEGMLCERKGPDPDRAPFFFFCLALSTTTAINHGISLMLSQNDDTDCGVENITSDWPKLTGRRLLN